MAFRDDVSLPARLDAKEYYSYLRDVKFTPDVAVRWYNELIDELTGLREMPLRFSVISEADELDFPYRSFIFYSHRVIFAVHEAENTVMIHRVWHGARKALTPGDL